MLFRSGRPLAASALMAQLMTRRNWPQSVLSNAHQKVSQAAARSLDWDLSFRVTTVRLQGFVMRFEGVPMPALSRELSGNLKHMGA